MIRRNKWCHDNVHIPHLSESYMNTCSCTLTLHWRTGNLAFISVMLLNFSEDLGNSTDINCFFFFTFFLPLLKCIPLHSIHSDCSILSSSSWSPVLPFNHLSSFPIHCFSIYLLKSIGVPRIATKTNGTKCNKTSRNLSYQGWMRQLSRRKCFQRSGKTVKDRPTEEKNKNIHIINNISDVIKRVKKLKINMFIYVMPNNMSTLVQTK